MNFDKDELDREASYIIWREWYYDVWCNPTDREVIERVIDWKHSQDFLPAEWDMEHFCPRSMIEK